MQRLEQPDCHVETECRQKISICASSPIKESGLNFKRGRTNLTDYLREGRPSMVTTEDNISAVRLMIEADKRMTYQQIWTSLGIATVGEKRSTVSVLARTSQPLYMNRTDAASHELAPLIQASLHRKKYFPLVYSYSVATVNERATEAGLSAHQLSSTGHRVVIPIAGESTNDFLTLASSTTCPTPQNLSQFGQDNVNLDNLYGKKGFGMPIANWTSQRWTAFGLINRQQ
ncbi:hypothetical protein EVAR_79734_1 [Eumeta japonica]|uniref:Uncharacterized protein n=1 Tax=Eumeta variegata TaxID=151549 RepID=A0A4C1TBU5_EUMVA|nr:hypothetical protein EVAR_79734_1 [Eumeta japonica]